MINIAVCDDDVQFAASLEEKILAYGKKKGVRIDTEVFSDGERFLQAVFNDSFYDLVYMDVEMGKRDGIYTVREVKKKLSEVLVIYTTSHETYFTEMFETEPFRYLKKPLAEEKFEEYFTRALERIQGHLCYFTYSSGHALIRIPFRDILYFESRRRQIILHGRAENDTFYGRLGTIEKDLEQGGCPFIRIHQSYLINPHGVCRYYPDRVEMENNAVLPISEARQREVKQKYHEFFRRL